MILKKEMDDSCYYYPTIVSYLGKGSGGVVYKGFCFRSDKYDALFPVVTNKHQNFVRKKFHDKHSFEYEKYHINYLRNVSQQWLDKYFCESLRSFSVTIKHYDDGCNENMQTFYTDLELLSTPKWKLLENVNDSTFGKMVDNGHFFRILIRALLDLHYNGNGATYFDVNPNNIFIDILSWNQTHQLEGIKFIDYGGIFHESYIDNNDDHSAFIANPYFLPQPGLSETISEKYQPNMLELVNSKQMLPVFYSVVCSVSMILDMLERLEYFCNFFEVVLDGMGKKSDLNEQTLLYCDIQYQAEFIKYLDNHIDDLQLALPKG